MKITNMMLVFTSTSANAFIFPATPSTFQQSNSRRTLIPTKQQNGRINALHAQINTIQPPWPYIPDLPCDLDEQTMIEMEVEIAIRLTRLPDTNDPYKLFNLALSANKKDIKITYRRMALKYHPDVLINSTSSKEERNNANDDFARINAAYAQLLRNLEAKKKKLVPTKGTTNDDVSWPAARGEGGPGHIWTN